LDLGKSNLRIHKDVRTLAKLQTVLQDENRNEEENQIDSQIGKILKKIERERENDDAWDSIASTHQAADGSAVAEVHVVVAEYDVDGRVGVLHAHAMEHCHGRTLGFDVDKFARIQHVAYQVRGKA
jgi:hypothetical protein